jgi:hypothetical protein
MSLLDWLTLARIGLLYDLVGAIILVWGFISQGKQEFQEEVSFFGPNEPKTAVSTKLDSVVGLSFILGGFLAQLIGSDDDVAAVFSSCPGGAIFALTVLLVGGGGYLVLRKFLFSHYLLYIKDKTTH